MDIQDLRHDDLSEDYMRVRSGSDHKKSGVDAMRELVLSGELERSVTPIDPETQEENPNAPVAVEKPTQEDDKRNAFFDAAIGAVNGPVAALQETVQLIGEIRSFIGDKLPGGEVFEVANQAMVNNEELAPAKLPETETGAGALTQGVTQFLTGFFGANKFLAPVKGAITKDLAAGAIADGVVFDPQDGNLSTLINEQFPELANPVTEFLDSSAEDHQAVGRLKNALEGTGLGAVATPFVAALRLIKRGRETESLPEQDPVKAEDAEVDVVADVGAPLDTRPEVLVKVDDTKAQNILEETDLHTIDEGYDFNFDRVESEDDVLKMVQAVSDNFETQIGKAKGETKPLDQIEAESAELLADELGLSDTIGKLNTSFDETADLPVKFTAYRKVLYASAKRLRTLADAAAQTGSDADLLAFKKHLARHTGIQAQVKGVQTNIARTLRAMSLNVGDDALNAKQVEDLMADTPRGNLRDLARKLHKLEDVKAINKFTQKSPWLRSKEVVQELYINGLLSGPRTFAVNTVGNTLTSVNALSERYLAAGFGSLRRARGGEGGVRLNEANAQIYALRRSFGDVLGISARGRAALKDAGIAAIRGDYDTASKILKAEEGEFGTALRAAVTGDPQIDNLSKIEVSNHRAISAENFNMKSGTSMARAVDYLGNFVRIPGRVLMTTDELFKGINYRRELHALAYREAADKIGRNDQVGMAHYITEVTENPPEHLHAAALEDARVATFTNPLGNSGTKLQELANDHFALKVIMPFIRTPVNILKYVGVRTPGLSALSKSVRDDIMGVNGPAKQDLAMAKWSTGGMLYTSAFFMADSGMLVGSHPKAERQAKFQAGQPEYAIKIDDEWIQYNRLDPFGMFLGLAADYHRVSGMLSDEEQEEIATAMMTAISNNLASKTWLSGVVSIMDAFNHPERYGERYFQNLAAAFTTPNVLAQVTTTVDPVRREVNSVMDKIISRIPGMSDTLHPQLDLFGEPVSYSGGLGPDLVSPIYTQDESNDPVRLEIARLGLDLKKVPKNIDGHELNPDQYFEYQRLAGQGLHDAIKKVMRSNRYKKALDGDESGGRHEMIKKVIGNYKSRARKQMIRKYDEIKEARRQEKIKRRNDYLGIETINNG